MQLFEYMYIWTISELFNMGNYDMSLEISTRKAFSINNFVIAEVFTT